MVSWIQQYRQKIGSRFGTSLFAEDFQQQIASRLIGLASVISLILATLYAVLGEYLQTGLALLIIIFLAFVSFYWRQSQQFERSMYLMFAGVFSALMVGITLSGGLFAPGYHAIHILLFAVGIILGRTALIRAALLVSAWTAYLYFLEPPDQFAPPPSETTAFEYSSQVIVFILMTTFILYAIIKQILNTRSRLTVERDHTLLANEKLRESEEQLEETVIARTAQLQQVSDNLTLANQAKTQFLANMTHELRTPLNGIINLTEIVSTGLAGPVTDEQKQYLDHSLASSMHLFNLVNDVLDMTKIQADRLDLYIEHNVDIYQEWETVNSIVQPMFFEKEHVAFKVVLDDDLPKISCDRSRLRQIFLNLISNAIKFTDEGEILVRIVTSNREIHFSCQDTGMGIDQGMQARIFEPFVQSTDKHSQTQGTGLGLSITKSLVEAHRGRLILESELGAGSIFHIWLPISLPESQTFNI